MKIDDWKLPLAVLGFVVAAALFVHYQPHKSGDVAAWVQAVASVVAILWAGYSARKLQNDIDRRKQKTSAAVLYEIADSVAKVTKYVKQTLPDRSALYSVARGQKRFEFGEVHAMERELNNIRLYELTGPEFVKPTLILRSSVRQLRENIAHAFESHSQMDASDYGKLFDAIHKLNEVCLETAEDVRRIAESI